MSQSYHNSPTKEQVKTKLYAALCIVTVILLYVFLEAVLGITCPIKWITGISCAGCGMSRAWVSVFHLNIERAMYYHPLFGLPPVILIVYLFKKKINVKFYKVFMFTSLALFVIVYLFRIFEGGSIVVFKPQENLLFRILGKFN